MPTQLQRPASAQHLADCMRHWDAQGWTPATSSNFSLRSDQPDTLWVSRTGVDKACFSETDFIPVTATDGQPLTDEKPSAETLLHSLIYQQYPAARVVAHTHSVSITVLSRLWAEHLHRRVWAIQGFELQKAFEGQQTHQNTLLVPLAPNSQNMTDIAAALTAEWQQPAADNPFAPGFIIVGHGLYTWATDVWAVKRHIATFEFLSQSTLECYRHGYHLHS